MQLAESGCRGISICDQLRCEPMFAAVMRVRGLGVAQPQRSMSESSSCSLVGLKSANMASVDEQWPLLDKRTACFRLYSSDASYGKGLPIHEKPTQSCEKAMIFSSQSTYNQLVVACSGKMLGG